MHAARRAGRGEQLRRERLRTLWLRTEERAAKIVQRRWRVMQATEMKVEVEEVLRDKERMLEGLSKFTGRSMELLRDDFKRDFYLTAESYGGIYLPTFMKLMDESGNFPNLKGAAIGRSSGAAKRTRGCGTGGCGTVGLRN